MKQYLKHLIMSLVLVLSILLISVPAEASSTPEVSYSNQSITSFMLKPNFMSNSWTGFRDAYIDQVLLIFTLLYVQVIRNTIVKLQ